MNIEKTECDRLGYEYTSLLEHIAYLCHHAPFIKDYINEETMKKFDDLCLKLATGDCEIIEFKRTLCKYNFTDVLKEKDDKIEQLQSNWNSLKDWVFEHIDSIEFNSYDDVLDKMNELEGVDNEEVKIIEEEKKIPEKIKDKYCSQISKVELAQKYNEIIDYLDYLKSKGE